MFKEYDIKDTTKIGCGFDFKLVTEKKWNYFVIEVKVINDKSGNIALTNKEYTVASLLKDRYFIFVVKNFKEKPFHQIYQDPTENLSFNKIRNKIVQISWSTVV
jgi:hypothetical protein